MVWTYGRCELGRFFTKSFVRIDIDIDVVSDFLFIGRGLRFHLRPDAPS